jgi:dihydrofolate reductase
MGRKTWDSLGRPLPGRRNLVVSRNPALHAPGAETFPSLDAALTACGEEEVFVIGGAELYAQALPRADRLYLTEIHQAFEGDALFPAPEPALWQEITREAHRSESGLEYSFVVLDRAR